MSAKFTRLVRFLAGDGKVYYGEAASAGSPTSARIITGDIFPPRTSKPGRGAGERGGREKGGGSDYSIADAPTPIVKLLSPIDPNAVRTVRGIGLNYTAHARETKLPIPRHPIVFHKPTTSLCGPTDPILIPRFIQGREAAHDKDEDHDTGGIRGSGGQSDYEAELAVVIGRATRDVSVEEAEGCVLGYTVANDVSQREWQIHRGGTQWSFSKGFDNACPFGPQLVAPSVLCPNGKGASTAASGLRIAAYVNGEKRQDSNTADLIFSVPQLISFLSQGTTLQPGDIILTGTPNGVGMSMTPPRWLKDGDVVVVEIERIGRCENKVVFETTRGGEAKYDNEVIAKAKL